MRPIIEAWPSRSVKILGYQRWYAQLQPQEKSKALEVDQRNDFCLGKLMISCSLADTGQRCTSEMNTMMQHQSASFRQPRQPESSLQTNSVCSGAENAATLPAASELAQLQPCANAAIVLLAPKPASPAPPCLTYSQKRTDFRKLSSISAKDTEHKSSPTLRGAEQIPARGCLRQQWIKHSSKQGRILTKTQNW